MTPAFGSRTNAIVRLSLLAVALLFGVIVVLAFPMAQTSTWATAVGYAPDQPIPFSHARHVAGLGLDCLYCHQSVEKSAFAGMPSTDTCMNCHSQLYTAQEMLAPVRESWRTGEPLRWRRVHDLPDFVFFNHAAHVSIGMSCVECHGHVEQMPLMQKAEPLTMKWCLDCHRDPNASLVSAPSDLVPTLNVATKAIMDVNARLLTDCSACHR